jgi:threonine synthase
MRFVSTRGDAPPVPLSGAITAGLAPDGGLYVPDALPRGPAPLGPAHDGETLATTAARWLSPWFDGDALAAGLADVCEAAYTFDAPLVALPRAGDFLLELFHGPTAAFKDFGARFLAACFERLRRDERGDVTVLVATSGDTGSAVGAAFHRRRGVRVVILYPDGRVSPRQAHQLGAFGDNVTALAVDGAFDDCQRLVKQAFADTALRAAVPLASANSISLGRLLPQTAYYVQAALRRPGLGFVVPTGNLGNAFACLLARAIGAPIGPVVLATNANRTIPELLATGEYWARPSVATLANAMDVGNPSNVERLLWLFPDAATLRAAVTADWVADDAIEATIAASEARYGRPVCPHTACGLAVLERLRAQGDARDWCVAATAHPAKFDTVVEPLVGHPVPPPPALAEVLARPAAARRLPADYAALVSALKS